MTKKVYKKRHHKKYTKTRITGSMATTDKNNNDQISVKKQRTTGIKHNITANKKSYYNNSKKMKKYYNDIEENNDDNIMKHGRTRHKRSMGATTIAREFNKHFHNMTQHQIRKMTQGGQHQQLSADDISHLLSKH
jgi:hypothetical protein